ncbi:MAG TPA: c-type cytochrome [Ignavibacteriaceae bacterium]
MKRNAVFAVLVSVWSTFLLLSFAGCVQEQQKKEMTQSELVERGKLLVKVGGCTDCHTPKVFGPEGPKPDPLRFLSGYPAENPLPKVDLSMIQPGKWVLFTQDITGAVGPWGASFAANLTPDNETGIGTWQPDMFINAMRTGKHLGAGRPILPPMPWQGVGELSDEDLNAIFAYLKSIKPVKNKVPEPKSLDQLTSIK